MEYRGYKKQESTTHCMRDWGSSTRSRCVMSWGESERWITGHSSNISSGLEVEEAKRRAEGGGNRRADWILDLNLKSLLRWKRWKDLG